MIPEQALLSHRETALWSSVEGGILIMDIDSGAYFEMDETGARIWALLEEPKSFCEVCDAVIDEYDVDPETCRRDTRNFLEGIEKSGLITVG